ncbi:MAG: hypothetical protein KDD35_08915, partial [Bdellovibrionales bacterium]|nr:hypothetical protein [Bdellovibrionales bacterium]
MAVYKLEKEYVLELAGSFEFQTNAPVLNSYIFGGYLYHLRSALEYIPQQKDFTVIISSDGGAAPTARAASEYINEKCSINGDQKCRVRVFVPSEGRCASACIRFFGETGSIKTAHPNAEFGFHAARNILNQMASLEDSRGGYEGFGIDSEWLSNVEKAGVFNKLEMSWFSSTEMTQVGLVDELVDVDISNYVNQLHGTPLSAYYRIRSNSELTGQQGPVVVAETYVDTIDRIDDRYNRSFGFYVSSGHWVSMCIGSNSSGIVKHPKRSHHERVEILRKLRRYKFNETKVVISVTKETCLVSVEESL